jgi:protein tyrosine phosphatase
MQKIVLNIQLHKNIHSETRMSSYTHADMILPRLWLGNKRASTDENFIRKHGINVVFNCTKDLPFSPLIPHQYRVPVDDNLQPAEITNMANWSPEIMYKLMAEYNRGGVILVHCFAGMQRSAAVVAMFLITLSGQPASQVIPYIRSRREVAFFPEVNFKQSILAFEKQYFLARNGHRRGGN